MTQLTTLTTLVMKKCHLKSVPSSLSMMKSLKVLDLSNNILHESYADLKNLTNLEELNLEYCRINNFENVDHLIHLKVLNLSKNNLIGSLSSIEHLENLQNLIMKDCRLSSFEVNTKKLVKLEYLDLENNNLSTIYNIDKLTGLKQLNLLKNENLSDLESIDNLDNLEELLLGKLTWKDIPESLVELSKLKKIQIDGPIGILNPVIFKFKTLEEIFISSNLAFDSQNLIGCTILKVVEDEFNIKSLFPHFSNDMIRDINLKETANLFPDLSCLKSLVKVSFVFTSGCRSINIIKENGKWFYDKGRSWSILAPITDDFQSVYNNDVHAGNNGVFIILPRSLLKYAQPSTVKDNIEIVEIIGREMDIFILDTESRVRTCNYRSESSLSIIEDLPKIIHIHKLPGSRTGFCAIDENGVIHSLARGDTSKIENYDVLKIFGNNKYALCVNKHGNMIEIYSLNSRFQKIIQVDDLPIIKSGITMSSNGYKHYSICIDEEGKIWIKQVIDNSQSNNNTIDNFNEWKQIKMSSSFVSIQTAKHRVIFATNQGEVMICNKKDLLESILSDNLPTLPIFCDYLRKISHIKSARN